MREWDGGIWKRSWMSICVDTFFIGFPYRARTDIHENQEGNKARCCRGKMEKPKLVIHLDINGTIMPADPIKSKHVDTMLNIHLSKQAFVRRRPGEDSRVDEVLWWTGAPFTKGEKPPLLPQFRYTCHIHEHYEEEEANPTRSKYPIQDAVWLEDFNDVCESDECDDFTAKHSPGCVYEPELQDLLSSLEWKHPEADSSVTEALTLSMKDGRRMSMFVPAFLKLLQYLFEHRAEQDYVLVIRTFGSDIPRLIPAFNLIANGQHPDVPQAGCIKEPHAFGQLARNEESSGEFTLELDSLTCPGSKEVIVSNDKIIKYFEGLDSGSVVMVCDDFSTWKAHNFDPVFGKPVFVDLQSIPHTRHFLFDDNVNMNPKDSIAAVWLKDSSESSCFRPVPLSSVRGKALIGTVLLQASLYFAIKHENEFVEELVRANARYNTLLARLGL